MKVIHRLTIAFQLTILVRENPSFTSAFHSLTRRTSASRFRESFLGSNHVCRSFRSTKTAFSMTSEPEEYDDGIGDFTNSNRNKDGEDLVAEFYKNLREREDTDASVRLDSNDGSIVNKPQTDTASFGLGQSPSSLGSMGRGSLFDTNEYFDTEEAIPKTPTRKFSGSDYFGGSNVGGSSADDSRRNQVRENMMRREYELVSGATGRTALTFQAGLAVCMLVFFLYVGLTGGIVTGDAAQMDFGGDDVLQFEEIIPIPRDSDQSVWI